MRVTACAAIAALGAASLAACGTGSGDGQSSGADSQSGSGSAQKIVFWQHTSPARDAVVQEVAQQFEADHPGVTVETQFIPYAQYFDKLVAALDSGTGPDVFQVAEEMSEQFIMSDLVAPVPEDVATTDQIAQDYLPAVTTRLKYEDKYWGMPTDVQTGILIANTDLLTQCGGDPDNLPKTWDDLKAMARQCTVRDDQGNITQAGLDTGGAWNITGQALYSDDPGTYFDAATCKADLMEPDTIARFDNIAQFVQGDDAVDSAAFLPGEDKFSLGKAVFSITLPVAIGTLEEQFPDVHFVVGQAPTDDGTPSTFVRSWTYFVNKATNDDSLAWQFVLALSDSNAQRLWFDKSGSLPATVAEINDPAITSDPNRAFALQTIKTANPNQAIGIKTGDALTDLWTNISVNQMAPKDALPTAQEQIQGYIEDALGCQP